MDFNVLVAQCAKLNTASLRVETWHCNRIDKEAQFEDSKTKYKFFAENLHRLKLHHIFVALEHLGSDV